MNSHAESTSHLPMEHPAEDPFLVSDARTIVTSYARFLWRHKLAFIALPLVFGIAAAAWAMTKPRLYRAQMTVAVSRASDQSATIVASFRPFLENNQILDEVVKEFKLDGQPFNFTRTTLSNRYAVEPVRNTNLVKVQLRLEDPALAAKVLARIGERAAELVRRTSADLGEQAEQGLQAAYQSAEQRLRKANADLQEFKKAAQIDVLRKDLDRALASRGDVEKLSILIAQERSRLAQTEAELEATTRFVEMNRTLEGDQLLGQAARSRSGDGLTLRHQSANPVYENLALEVAKTRANLAGHEAQRRELTRNTPREGERLPLLSRVYEAEQGLSELDTRQAIALSVFKEAANNYELARVRILGAQAQLTIIDPPLPPDVAEPRRLGMTAVFGALLGFMVALAVAVFIGSTAASRVGRPEII